MDLEFIPQEYGGKGISDEKLFSSYTLPFVQYLPSWKVLGQSCPPRVAMSSMSKTKKPLKQ